MYLLLGTMWLLAGLAIPLLFSKEKEMREFTQEIIIDDTEYLVEFEASPVIPAQISGPPEYCYPAEGGDVDILRVFIQDVEVTKSISKELRKKFEDWITDHLSDLFANDDFDDFEPDFDD